MEHGHQPRAIQILEAVERPVRGRVHVDARQLRGDIGRVEQRDNKQTAEEKSLAQQLRLAGRRDAQDQEDDVQRRPGGRLLRAQH